MQARLLPVADEQGGWVLWLVRWFVLHAWHVFYGLAGACHLIGAHGDPHQQGQCRLNSACRLLIMLVVIQRGLLSRITHQVGSNPTGHPGQDYSLVCMVAWLVASVLQLHCVQQLCSAGAAMKRCVAPLSCLGRCVCGYASGSRVFLVRLRPQFRMAHNFI